jgi:hypothetical protein
MFAAMKQFTSLKLLSKFMFIDWFQAPILQNFFCVIFNNIDRTWVKILSIYNNIDIIYAEKKCFIALTKFMAN